MEALHSLCFPDRTSASVKIISSIVNTFTKCILSHDYQNNTQTKLKKKQNKPKPKQTLPPKITTTNKNQKQKPKARRKYFLKTFFFTIVTKTIYTFTWTACLWEFSFVNSILLFTAPLLQWVYYNISNALIISGFGRKNVTKGGLLCNLFL